ncbi:MAG: ABC transporter permease [Thermomicrobiales bacterium]
MIAGVREFVRLQVAFLRRDWQYETTYRGMMILQMLGIVGTLVIFFSIGKLVSPGADSLARYGGEYFPFALVGLVVSDYFNTGLRSFSNRLRLAQTTGTLEAMFVSARSPRLVLMFSGAWDFLIATVRLAIGVAIGVLLLGVDFDPDYVAAAIISVLSLATFAALGLFAAALILIIKRGDAVAALGNIFATVFAGALFPISLLPDWLRWVAYILPLHYSLDGLRRALLVGDGLPDLREDLVALSVSAAVLLPLSIVGLGVAVSVVRRDGSVGMH